MKKYYKYKKTKINFYLCFYNKQLEKKINFFIWWYDHCGNRIKFDIQELGNKLFINKLIIKYNFNNYLTIENI